MRDERTKSPLFSSLWMILVLVAASVGAWPTTGRAAEVEEIFGKGETLAGEWSIERIEHHREFVRLHFGETVPPVAVEITTKPSSGNGESADCCLVQPAPGAQPPDALILAVRQRLEDAKKRGESLDWFLAPVQEKPFEEGNQDQGFREISEAAMWFVGLMALWLAVVGFSFAFRRRRGKPTNGWKYVFAYATGLPLLFLVALSFDFFLAVQRSESVDGEELRRAMEELEASLPHKQTPSLSFDEKRKRAYFRYDPVGMDLEYSIAYDPQPGEKKIYAFGASSLVFPEKRKAFPARVERILQSGSERSIRVYNFALGGLDSLTIRRFAEKSIRHQSPDAVLMYLGHNDFGYVYRELLFDRFSLVQNSHLWRGIFRIINRLRPYDPETEVSVRSSERFEVWRRWLLDPWFLSLARQLGFANYPQVDFAEINRMVLRGYVANVEAVVNLCRAHNITVFLVIPVSNLDIPPLGLDDSTRQTYLAAWETDDLNERRRLLEDARERDVFTFGTRAKNLIGKKLKTWHAPKEGVYVFDISDEIEPLGMNEQETPFTDSMHFSPRGHELVAIQVAERIRNAEKNVIIPGTSEP